MAEQVFTSGQILTASQMATLQSNIGLAFISRTTATSGATVSVNNCFSATYNNYRVIVSDARTGVVAAGSLRMRTGGTDNTTSNYFYNGQFMGYTATTITGINGSAVTNFDSNMVTEATNSSSAIYDIFSPFQATSTGVSGSGLDQRTGGGGNRTISGFFTGSTSFDGITFITGSTFTNVVITVYGYRIS